MHQQVNFQAEPSATSAGQWIGVVRDSETERALTRTSLTFPTPSEARFAAKRKWQGRSAQIHSAMAGCAA